MTICRVPGHWEEQVLPGDAWRRGDSVWDLDAILDVLGALSSGSVGEQWALELAERIVPRDCLMEIGFVHIDSRGALLRPAPTAGGSDLLLWTITRVWSDTDSHHDLSDGRALLRVRNQGSGGLGHMCVPVGLVGDVRAVLACAITAGSRGEVIRLASRLTLLTSFLSCQAQARGTETGGTSDREPAAEGPTPGYLTARQMRILQGMAEGLTNRQIAARICFSESTVRLESMAIYRHFGVHSRTRAVALARESGVLQQEALSASV